MPEPIQLADESLALTDPSAAFFLTTKKACGMLSGWEVEHLDRKLPNAHVGSQVVQGLIARSSVNILVGDSGIGKSPLAYQLGMAAAAAVPFLGMSTAPAKVMYLDFENNLADVQWIATQQRKFLGLEKIPPTFLLWPLSRDPLQESVAEVVRRMGPDLVIIDSLRAYKPEMESDAVKAVQEIRILRQIAAQHGTAILLIHHLRKNGQSSADGSEVALENGHALDWLRRAAGVRALINQTDARLALARRAPAKVREEGAADLVLSGHYRTRGEVGPYLIERKWDAAGDPVGYARYEPSPAMIGNSEHEAVYAALGQAFTFGDARVALDRGAETTNWFIHKLVRLGLAHKTGRGQYSKCVAVSAEPSVLGKAS